MSDRVALLIERLARVLHNDAHMGGLKPTQWEALRYLARANRFSRSPGALTAYLGMTKGTVSQTLLALERKGLIEKSGVDGDRRSVRLELTRSGMALLSDDPMASLDAALDDMPVSVQKALSTHLEHLLKTLIAKRGGRPFGACKTCVHFRKDHRHGAPHYCSLVEETLSEEDSARICVEQELAAGRG